MCVNYRKHTELKSLHRRKIKHVFSLTVTMRLDRRKKSGKIVKEIGKRNDLRRSTFSFTGGQDNEELGLCTLLNK